MGRGEAFARYAKASPLFVLLCVALNLLLVSCGSSATSAPPTPTATVAPTTPAPPAPTRTVAPATPTIAANPTARLVTDNIQYSGALSVEDLNTLLLDIRTLPGVQDAQGGAQELQITYDPTKTTHQQIVDVIRKHNYSVKE